VFLAWTRSAATRYGDAGETRPVRPSRRYHAPGDSLAFVRCEECGAEPAVEAHAAGWVAFRVDLPDDPDKPEVIPPSVESAGPMTPQMNAMEEQDETNPSADDVGQGDDA
jgi:hypothetical protein